MFNRRARKELEETRLRLHSFEIELKYHLQNYWKTLHQINQEKQFSIKAIGADCMEESHSKFVALEKLQNLNKVLKLILEDIQKEKDSNIQQDSVKRAINHLNSQFNDSAKEVQKAESNIQADLQEYFSGLSYDESKRFLEIAIHQLKKCAIISNK